jgi:peptide deformylase
LSEPPQTDEPALVLPIAQLGQPVLRQVARPVLPAVIGTRAFQQLLNQMEATLRQAGGVGLAGPQVFDGRRLFLGLAHLPTHDNQELEFEAFINPVLRAVSEDRESAWEGCLSFMELSVLVPRHQAVRVEYLDRKGQLRSLELEGFAARVFQHELDHLDGVLTIDRAASTRDIVKASELETVLQHREGEGEES